ncbi:DUF4194 domain-containing protein [Jonesia quinghaiensis]|uniref:DUF4194 domain-containing protein n=1 Tax=Jonesia quinghaiensis TaxID=262806 RepID=UPI0003FF7BEB|nr:DUF4194 domain-containing protein [Jonesia quinghaiensis]
MSDEPFVDTTPVEAPQTILFDADRGQLPSEARRALALLLQKRFVDRANHPAVWRAILTHEDLLQSRFHDMFLTLIVDRNYDIAYKQQVRLEDTHVPILLKDEAYKRVETLVLIHLRTVYRQHAALGAQSVFVDSEDLIDYADSFFPQHDTNQAARHHEIRAAINQLTREGVMTEREPGRYQVSSVIEILLPVSRLTELTQWLTENTATPTTDQGDLL